LPEIKKKNARKQLVLSFCPKSTSKHLGLALNSLRGEVISHHDGNAFFSEAFRAGPCQGEDTSLDRRWR